MQEEGNIGIYRFYNRGNGMSFVGFSRNLQGTRKRLQFELKLNACSYKHLQAFYHACDGNIAYEVLEEIDPLQFDSDWELQAHMQARLYHYKGMLQAQMIQMEV